MNITLNISQEIKYAPEEDSELKAIREILKETCYEDYLTKNGILYKMVHNKELLIAPKSMHIEIIKNAHEE